MKWEIISSAWKVNLELTDLTYLEDLQFAVSGAMKPYGIDLGSDFDPEEEIKDIIESELLDFLIKKKFGKGLFEIVLEAKELNW